MGNIRTERTRLTLRWSTYDPRTMIPSFLLMGELLTLVLLAGASKLALAMAIPFILFPELSALSYNVFSRPAGTWANAPVMMVITPTVTAACGVLITQHLAYGWLSVALCVTAAILLMRLLRSPIAPAISAGFLPLVLGLTSWQYPASIAFVTAVLAMSSIAYRRILSARIPVAKPSSSPKANPRAGRTSERFAWVPVFAGFLMLAYALGALTGLRLILFPPLIVIAYEMFVHPDTCPWAARPYALAAVSTFAAGVGVALVTLSGVGPLSVAIGLIVSVVTLRLFKLNFPPALAICLLPQIIAAPGLGFIAAVALGSVTLAITFVASRAARRAEVSAAT
jgi:hypothetical protein